MYALDEKNGTNCRASEEDAAGSRSQKKKPQEGTKSEEKKPKRNKGTCSRQNRPLQRKDEL